MNIYDISKQAGVSIATVSRVLNNNARVSEKTRKKVLQVMEEANYTPNPFARGLGLDSMCTVGILYLDVSDIYLSNAVYHLEKKLREHKYDCLLCCTGYDLSSRQKYIELLLSKRVDAIILVGSYFVEETDALNEYIRAAAQQVPVAILNGYLQGNNICCVTCDDYAASFELASFLLQSGSRDILYLYHSQSGSTRRKIAGLLDAYAQQGLTFRESNLLCCPFRDIDDCMQFLQSLPPEIQFDTVMASDDALGVGALKYARMGGIAVPETLRVAGYNDSVLSKSCTPELTTVDNKLGALCILMVDMLLYGFAGEKMPSHISVKGDVLHRESTNLPHSAGPSSSKALH